jgi:hypothetical protein
MAALVSFGFANRRRIEVLKSLLSYLNLVYDLITDLTDIDKRAVPEAQFFG